MKEHPYKILQHIIEFPSFVSRDFYQKYGVGDRKKTEIRFTGTLYEKEIRYDNESYLLMRLDKVCHYENQNATPQILWIQKNGSPTKLLQISTVGVNLKKPSFSDIRISGEFLREEVNILLETIRLSPSMHERIQFT